MGLYSTPHHTFFSVKAYSFVALSFGGFRIFAGCFFWIVKMTCAYSIFGVWGSQLVCYVLLPCQLPVGILLIY